MQDRVLLGLTVLWFVTAASSGLIHGLIVCPRLYRNGARPPVGLLPWRLFDDMRRYKELCRAASDSLNPCYIYGVLLWFNIGFGIVVGLLNLWKHTHPL